MDNDFIDDFIEEYKNQPCLWQASSTDFKNRKKRQEAYYKLIEVASRHGEHYNIERTKQKINNLRCAFRQQLKKFTESKNSKGGKEESYCPKRRYFESLMFLLNEERPERNKVDNSTKEIVSTKEVESYTETYAIPVVNEHEEEQRDTSSTTVVEQRNEYIEAPKDNNVVQIEVQCDDDVNILWPRASEASNSNEPIHIATATVNTVPEPIPERPISVASHDSSQSLKSENAPKKVKIDCDAKNFEKLLTLACSKINTSDIHEDDFAIFGKMVAFKLRSMDTQQSMIAQKLICDVLLEGQMKMLSYPVRTTMPYRNEGQAFVISSLNLNGSTDTHSQRDQQHSTPTIHYSSGNGSQI